MIYYTEYPTREFTANSDKEALDKTKAHFVYRESDAPDGLPFIVLRNEIIATSSQNGQMDARAAL